MKQRVYIEIICFLFIVLFFYAGVTKLIDHEGFVGQMGKSPLLTRYANWIAWLIPTVEIIITILLALPRWRSIGLYASFGLMTLFTFYIIAILSYSKELPCACGGVINTLDWKEHLVFNLFFVLLAILGINFNEKSQRSKNNSVSI